MATFNSFISTNQYNRENVPAAQQLTAGFLTGQTYVAPTFNTSTNVPSNNPGNLYGWLLYAKTVKSSPATGTTADTYVFYSNPTDFVNDLNKLSSATGAIINATGITNPFGFFIKDTTNYVGITGAGREFLYALDYLSYGGKLVIAGSTVGFYEYKQDYNDNIDILMGATLSPFAGYTNGLKWLELESPYTIGVYPTIDDGAGYTALPYPFTSPVFVEGATVADRVFGIYGQKTVTDLPVPSLFNSAKISYTNNLTADISGFFTRSNARDELYLTIAGSGRGTVLNGEVSGTVDWSDTAFKSLLKNNRVNYFLNFTNKFLGSDLVGATASTAEVIVDERVGPAQMKTVMKKDITNIGIKYLYQINNTTTRSQVTGEIQNYLTRFANVVDTTKTQIVCNGSNNTDNSGTLNIFVSVTPLVGTTTFTLNINLAQ